MGLAFWRRSTKASDAVPNRSSARAPRAPGDDEPPKNQDEAASLRARARRRLIGAAALLLGAAVVVPMFLDPEPRPVRDTIAIDIPSEKTPFTPRLSLPPVPAPESAPLAPPSDAPATASPPAASRAEDDRKTVAKAAPATASSVEEQRARAALEGKSGSASAALPRTTKGGEFAVQAAAPASEAAARDLVERLKKAGLASYVEPAETKDGTRYRVRLGPYAARSDAEKVQVRLKTIGIVANVVAL